MAPFPGLGQPVLVPGRVELVQLLLDDTLRLESAQTAAEDVARRARVPLDRVEAVDAEGKRGVERANPIADHRQGSGDRAGAGAGSDSLIGPFCHRGLTFPTL